MPWWPRARAPTPARPAAIAKSYLAGKLRPVAVYRRERLRAGEQFAGPAILTEYSATSLVPAGWRARVDPYGQIHLSMAATGAGRYGR